MQDLLAQLKDIHAPSDITWQLAWGWWFVILLTIIVWIILIFYVLRSRQKQRLKNQVKQSLKDALNNNNPAVACLLILRAYADFCYPEADINTFNEQQWQKFLAQKLPLSKELSHLFSESMYQKKANINKLLLLNYCQKWVDCV